jgi:hypothetical protein
MIRGSRPAIQGANPGVLHTQSLTSSPGLVRPGGTGSYLRVVSWTIVPIETRVVYMRTFANTAHTFHHRPAFLASFQSSVNFGPPCLFKGVDCLVRMRWMINRATEVVTVGNYLTADCFIIQLHWKSDDSVQCFELLLNHLSTGHVPTRDSALQL